MVYYELIKISINAPRLVKLIIDLVIFYHGLPNSIVTDQDLLFTLKFWSLLCYFFDIKKRLSTAFYLRTDGQTKCQNNTMKVYLWAFVNFEQNN